MDLAPDSALYHDALAAAKIAEERHEASTRSDYQGSLRRFAVFCEEAGYPNPLKHRFLELPSVMAAYINKLAVSNKTQWPAEKLRAAISWHYTKPEMLAGGQPNDKWVVETDASGRCIARGNPAKSPMIAQIMTGLNKMKKRARTPTRASPMSLPMLTKMIDFLADKSPFNQTTCLWFSAVSSLCFLGMCRINEVLQMKYRDIQLGLERSDSRVPKRVIKYGCFTIRDRKTDSDPSASRTYNMHKLPRDERAAEAITFVSRWFDFASRELQHVWSAEDFAFPALSRIPRREPKRRKTEGNEESGATPIGYEKVVVKWGSAMSDNNFIQVLNIVASASGISRGILGDEIWFTSHCFRRGGAQYRFMFSPEPRRWSLKMVKWWGGWSPNEQSETLVRYLLDDVLDQEENQLGDALAPDMIDHINDAYMNPIESSEEPRTLDLNKQLVILKEGLLTEIHEMLSSLIKNEPQTTLAHAAQPLERTASNAAQQSEARTDQGDAIGRPSDLTHVTTWKAHWEFYWKSEPLKHQFRPGCEMQGHERKSQKHKLSRMRTIAEYVRTSFNDNIDACETHLIERLGPALTVNKVCTYVRQHNSTLSQSTPS